MCRSGTGCAGWPKTSGDRLERARRRRWIAFTPPWLFVWLLPAALSAQEGQLRFERISIEQGLSHSTVWAIHQDALGFLWFGTQDGLNRYDGYDLEVFKQDPDDPDSLSASEVFDIYEDRGGMLWIGTRGGGLNGFHRAEERFEHFRHDPQDESSLSHDWVWTILEDRAGTLWVGTDDGFNRSHGDGTFTRYLHDPDDPSSLPGRRVFAVLEDRAGELWIGTDAGLSRFDRGTETFTRVHADSTDTGEKSGDEVFAIQEDLDGRVWIATRRGLCRFDRATGAFARFRHDPADPRSLSQAWLPSLLVDSAGVLWIGTQPGGLNRLEGGRDAGGEAPLAFSHYRRDPIDPHSLSSDSVLAIHEDRTGVLWLGTRAGVNKYVPASAQFVTYRQRPGRQPTLSGERVWAIYEDRAQTLWVGTVENGLNRIDRRRGTIDHYGHDPGRPGSLRHGTVSAILEDRSGVLWVGTWGGLSRLDDHSEPGAPARFRHYRYDPADAGSLSDNRVLTLREDSAGRLWIGTAQGFQYLDRETGRFVRVFDPDDPQSPAREAFYAIAEDRSGTLWFGSFTGGLYQLDRGAMDALGPGGATHRLRRLRHDPADRNSLSSDRIAVIHEDRGGELWIGTYSGGLNRLDAGREEFRHYRERDGLPSDSVLGILEDADGNLWLSTYFGLSQLDPASETFRNFDLEDGLQDNVFNSGSSFRSPSGEMFFGGIHGLNAFFPDRIAVDPVAPPVVVTEFQLFNKPAPLRRDDPDSPLERSILETESLTLSHRHYAFGFEFAALHYAKPRKNRYAYRLEGFDRDWIVADSTKRFAQYSNLDPGRYVFRVKASNGDGVWNEQGSAVRITVRPAPWKSWWAYALYALVISTGLVAYLRSQRRKVERERAINRRLREVDRIKDELLAQRAKSIDERTAEVAERQRLIEELEAKNTELERFTYTASHDLKSPLVTIKGFLGLLERDASAGDAARMKHDIERIRLAADNMHELLEDLLELSRVGRQVHPPETVSLGEVAREAIDAVAGQIDERGVEVVISPDLPEVRGDRVRLMQLMQNLIGNAVKFLDREPAPRVEVGVRREGEETVFFVRDNGIGIEPRYQEQIFGLFDRLDQQREGTGIGLTLVKRIVELHGGRIWVESEGQGLGSTFCFTLPEAGEEAD